MLSCGMSAQENVSSPGRLRSNGVTDRTPEVQARGRVRQTAGSPACQHQSIVIGVHVVQLRLPID